MSNLILPGTPEFEETLGATLPPGWMQMASGQNEAYFIVRPGSEIMEAVTEDEYYEYQRSGEWDERTKEIEDDDGDTWFDFS